MKTCNKCGVDKELSEYSRNSETADGHLNSCKKCLAEIRLAKRADRDKDGRTCRDPNCPQVNPQPLTEYSQQGWICRTCRVRNQDIADKNWRNAHPDDNAARAKAWREDRKAAGLPIRPENSRVKEQIRERERYATDPAYKQRKIEKGRAWRAANPERARELGTSSGKTWRRKNLEEARRRARIYYRNYPTPETHAAWEKSQREKYSETRFLSEVRRRSNVVTSPDDYTSAHIKWLVRWQDYCCCYCHAPFYFDRTREHIVAISRTPKGSSKPYNIALACSGCNTSKQARLFHLEWLPEKVVDTPRVHSIWGMETLADALDASDIPFNVSDDHLEIGETKVFVLSTFWLGWQGGEYLKQMRQEHDNALFIFDYEWRDHPDAVLNVMKAKAGLYKSVGARTLNLITPSTAEAKAFMDLFHIQGFAPGTQYKGIADENEVYAMASFMKKNDHWELARMAFKGHVSGGLSRIVKDFSRSEGLSLKSYCDPRWGTGGGYLAAGFTDLGVTAVPSYYYANGTGLYNRSQFNKDHMATRCDFFDPNLTEIDNAKANGLLRIDGLPQRIFSFE